MNSLKHLIMSNASRNFVKRSCGTNYIFLCGKRQLYSPASLKLDSLEDNRNKAHLNNFPTPEFIQKMKKLASPENDEVIFSSDIMKMLRIVNSEEDLLIFLTMLKKYTKQNATVQFSSYKFGPQVMRLFHLLKKPREALALREDKDLMKLFSPVSCKIVLFDLLYENQMYEEIIRLFKEDPTKNRASALVIIYFAACWKANTQESYKAALQTHQEILESHQIMPAMARYYLALLCLEQNNPAGAFEILDNSIRTIPANIKARALAKANRFRDLFALMDKFIKSEKEAPIRSVITTDTVNFISAEIEKANLRGEEKTKWNNIFQALEENQLFETKTLEEKICEFMSRKLVYRKSDSERQMMID